MTPEEIEAARINAEFERKLMFVSVVSACGISAFMIVLLLVSPLLALPAAVLTWGAGYLLYRYLKHNLPMVRAAWRVRRAHDSEGDAAPLHDTTALTPAEEATFAAITRTWDRA